MILVVANRTSSTPALLEEVAERTRGKRCSVLIPPEHGRETGDDWSQEEAKRLLGGATGGEVECIDCGDDALDTIQAAVDAGAVEQIIVSTPTSHLARWVHHDLPHRLEHLGVPVVVIAAEEEEVPDDIREGLPTGWHYPTVTGF